MRLALELRRDLRRGSRELRPEIVGLEVPRREPRVEPLEQRMHELADLAGVQVFALQHVVGREDSQDLLCEVAEGAGGEPLEAGRREVAGRAGPPRTGERAPPAPQPAPPPLPVQAPQDYPR